MGVYWVCCRRSVFRALTGGCVKDRYGLTIESPWTEETELKLLVFGQSNAGKTVFAATAVDDVRSAPVLFLDFELGTLSIRHKRAVQLHRIVDADGFDQVYRVLVDHAYDEDFPYKTLVVDSLTRWSEYEMTRILSKPGPTRRDAPQTPSIADWNTWTNLMNERLKLLTTLPMNVIMTALEETENGVTIPLLKGRKLAPQINQFFDVVGRLSVVRMTDSKTGVTEYQRRLLLQGDERIRVRDRTDGTSQLEPELADPTMGRILDRLAVADKLAAEA